MLVYIGIDWSEKKHDICYLNQNGEVILSIKIEQTPDGHNKFDTTRQRLGITATECLIGIETSHNALVDYLVERGYSHIFVIPPNAVKSAQGRYRQSGAKSDQSDARLIADMLRVDQNKYVEWQPDSELTRQIRAHVSMIGFQNKLIRQTENRLRATLLRYYPAALEVFSSLQSQITLEWICKYPTPREANQVTYADFAQFAKENHHPQPKKWPACYARLNGEHVTASDDITQIYARESILLSQVLLQLVRSKMVLLKKVDDLFEQHPDYEIFHSLPGAGAFLEPALLAKLGDNRQRFPSHHVLQAVAGTCPVTIQSGKSRYSTFRRACDHEFRQIVQQWAKSTINYSLWAVTYFELIRPSCESDNEAYRKLANRWLEVLWRLWYDRCPYDEQKHLMARAKRKRN
jgi:transposase